MFGILFLNVMMIYESIHLCKHRNKTYMKARHTSMQKSYFCRSDVHFQCESVNSVKWLWGNSAPVWKMEYFGERIFLLGGGNVRSDFNHLKLFQC